MEAKKQSFHLTFFQTYFFPALFIFLIPGLSILFLGLSQSRIDREFLESVENDLNRDQKMSAEDKQATREFFRANPISKILAGNDPQWEPLRNGVGDTMKWYCLSLQVGLSIAWWSIIMSLAVLLICPWPLLFSIRFPEVNYYVISLEWNILKIFCMSQVLGQAYLVIALSFWITATFFNVYYLKLILLAILLAVLPVVMVIRAIFANTDSPLRVKGKVLHEEQAPRFWARLEALAQACGARMPDHVILGLEDTFFVTEGDVACNDGTLTGRTLFLSLPMLRVVDRRQADAVFAHELGHFSGEDTVYSKKIAPLLSRYAKYLELLHQNPISYPVFYFMCSFWSFFHWSLGTYNKKREHRADQIGAQASSPQDFAVGLLLVSAYSGFRSKLETEYFSQDKLTEDLDLSETIRVGYWNFVREYQGKLDSDEIKASHPFDSHPSYHERLAALGITAIPKYQTDFAEINESQTWIPEISIADEWEDALWAEYQQEFRNNHELSLAFRYLPETEEEQAIVDKHFPVLNFTNKKGYQLTITHNTVHFPDTNQTFEFHEIESLGLEQEFITKHIYIQFAGKKKKVEKFLISGFDAKHEVISEKIGQYFGRFRMAREYLKNKKAEEAKSSTEIKPSPGSVDESRN